MRKLLLIVSAIVLAVVGGVYAAFQLSPWPAVLLIRHSADQGAADAAASIAPIVPEGVQARYGLSYAPDDRFALLDVFTPGDAEGPLPAVVWVHGGGFISGSRSELSGYLKVLAASGYAVIALDYAPAPEAQFPTPVRQVNAALDYILANAERLNVDPQRIFLAGDSAGAQIAAQTALIISDPAYARRLRIDPGMSRAALRGVVLFCGPYEPATMNFEGPFGDFMRTVIWSYVGTRDPGDARVAQISVTPHVSSAFPPTFISVGNADPLEPQSRALAEALRARGVEVDDLFFPEEHQPPLDHEYQLLLSTEAGGLALDRYTKFLAAHAGPAEPMAAQP